MQLGKLTEAAERIKRAKSLDPADSQLKGLSRKVIVARAKDRAGAILRRR
jgi:hypothetical protein